MQHIRWPKFLLAFLVHPFISAASANFSFTNASTAAATYSMSNQSIASAAYSLMNEFNATNFFEKFEFFTMRPPLLQKYAPPQLH